MCLFPKYVSIADTMSDATTILQQSLHTTDRPIQDWGHMGQSIRDALSMLVSLDQSVQEVGRKLNQRIDEAGQSFGLSVQQSISRYKMGRRMP